MTKSSDNSLIGRQAMCLLNVGSQFAVHRTQHERNHSSDVILGVNNLIYKFIVITKFLTK